MPHIPGAAIVAPHQVPRVPVANNVWLGGACYDPSTGEALYGVTHGGQMQVFRTRAGYRSLVEQDASVDYLATIDAGPWLEPTTVALQRIGGTLYANVSGRLGPSKGAGQWIYRDTSAAQDGAGPWVKHGTVHEITSYGTSGSQEHLEGGANGGEILVVGDLWATNCVIFEDFSNAYTISRQGVATSSDGGATWTVRLDVGWYLAEGGNGFRWSRNFAKYGGAWYVGGAGNVDPGQHFKSADLLTWTSIGNLGFGPDQGVAFPFSNSHSIYRFGGDSITSRKMQYASGAPETMPAWSDYLDLTVLSSGGSAGRIGTAFPYICNIGPPGKPLWVVFLWGQVLGLDVTTGTPPCRQWPRADGLAASSARRRYPIDKSEQASPRRAGRYW